MVNLLRTTMYTGMEQPIIPFCYKTQYNYKCPHCGGEFNTPCRLDTFSMTAKDVRYVCPFCGYDMIGLNMGTNYESY